MRTSNVQARAAGEMPRHISSSDPSDPSGPVGDNTLGFVAGGAVGALALGGGFTALAMRGARGRGLSDAGFGLMLLGMAGTAAGFITGGIAGAKLQQTGSMSVAGRAVGEAWHGFGEANKKSGKSAGKALAWLPVAAAVGAAGAFSYGAARSLIGHGFDGGVGAAIMTSSRAGSAKLGRGALLGGIAGIVLAGLALSND